MTLCLISALDNTNVEEMPIPVGIALFFMALNFAISWFNAWSCGRAWADSKAIGGLPRFTVWCGAIMSASGFTWVFTVLLAMLFGLAGKLPAEYVVGTIELGYLVVILPIIGSGLGITVHSITAFWRQKSLLNGGVAAYNTYAQVHNMVSAVRSVPPILDHLGDLLGKGSKGGNSKGKGAQLMIILVVIAVLGGILLTTWIIRSTSAKYSEKVFEGIELMRDRKAATA